METNNRQPRVVYVDAPRQPINLSALLALLIMAGLLVAWFARPYVAAFLATTAPAPTIVLPPAVVQPHPRPAYQTAPYAPAQPVQEEAPPLVAPVEVPQEGARTNVRTFRADPPAAPIVTAPPAPAENTVSVGGSLDIGLGGISAEGSIDVVRPAPDEGIIVIQNAAPVTQEGAKTNRRTK